MSLTCCATEDDYAEINRQHAEAMGVRRSLVAKLRVKLDLSDAELRVLGIVAPDA